MKQIFKISKIISFLICVLPFSLQAQNYIYSLTIGDTAVLYVTNSTPDSVQWQESPDSLNWVDIPGATFNPQTIITTSSSTGKKYFRAKIRDNNICANHMLKSKIITHKIISSSNEVAIGDWYRGGVVYYNDGSGNGLISPIQDISIGYEWGCMGTTTGATSLTDGASNTIAIVTACPTRPIPASVCGSLVLNEYSDWFLPAYDQLIQLFEHANIVHISTEDPFPWYWTSTEVDSDNAFLQGGMATGTGNFPKNTTFSTGVRCIRSYNNTANNKKTNCYTVVNLDPIFQNEEICLVSVDSTLGKNLIIFEKTPNVGIESFNIYKETGINEYSLIGNVPFNQPSFFIDNNSQPESHGDKYKISILDSCGQMSDLSYFHKTINLTIAVNGTNMGLNWDDYVDESGTFIPSKFYIFRGPSINNLTLYDSISASFHSYNDVSISTSYYYMIGIKKTNECSMNKTTLNMAFSNKKQNFSNNVNEVDEIDNYLKISPNPFSDYTTVTIINNEQKEFDISISDIAGNVVCSYKNVIAEKFKIERNNLKSGIYFIDIVGDKTLRGKLIVE